MTALEALESVQYVTVKGKRLAVVSADEWEAMIEWLETLEDVELAKGHLLSWKRPVGIGNEQNGVSGMM
jgi:hypothetical protein